MTQGLGWGFYAFFLYAAAWVIGYFLWAAYANRRDREKEMRRD